MLEQKEKKYIAMIIVTTLIAASLAMIIIVEGIAANYKRSIQNATLTAQNETYIKTILVVATEQTRTGNVILWNGTAVIPVPIQQICGVKE